MTTITDEQYEKMRNLTFGVYGISASDILVLAQDEHDIVPFRGLVQSIRSKLELATDAQARYHLLRMAEDKISTDLDAIRNLRQRAYEALVEV